jgi:tRNA A-37 threonylcarbamoyl transferase component Bud32
MAPHDDADLQAQLAASTDPQATTSFPAAARPEVDAASPSLAGHDAVRYQVLRPHARGGLGQVFVALDREVRREVALKEMQPQHADDTANRGRFLREAEITGGLEHPGIVPVYGLGQYADGRPFYAMRLIQGETLKDAVKQFHAGAPAVTLRGLLTRFVAVCNAVGYVHSRGVLHRDLKPANVMLGKYGETLVVDWGLAKAAVKGRGPGGGEGRAEDAAPIGFIADSGTAETMAGSAIGTPTHMSPEQASGQLDRIGPASDVYRLWDPATGAELCALRPGVGRIYGLAFSPDGTRLAFSGADGELLVADGRPLSAEVRVEQQAVNLVDGLFARPMLQSAVLEQIRGHKSLSEPVRRLALELAARYPDEPERFERASRNVVRERAVAPSVYGLAVTWAETACGLARQDGRCLTTLGIAYYRTGRHADALTALTKADQLNQGKRPADAAFLAMTQHRLGHAAEAKASLNRLQQLMKQATNADKETLALATEAEEVLRNLGN